MTRRWTSAEREAIAEACRESVSVPAALERARSLGLPIQDSDALYRALRPLGVSPSTLVGRAMVPIGHRVRGNSTLTNAAGAPQQQWRKTELDSSDPPKHEPVPEGHHVSKVSTLVDAQGNVRAQWIQSPKLEQQRWDQFWAACARESAQYKGLAKPTKAAPASDADYLTVYPLGDPHIGMLSWGRETGNDFDVSIAVRDLYDTLDLLVRGAPESEIGVLANLGDFFHAESDAQVTPRSGSKLDVDTRWAKIAEAGFGVMRRMIDRMLQKHSVVRVVNVPGNHDPQMARMLSIWLKALYERETRVEIVPNLDPYICMQWGTNLIGFAHNDGAKIDQLPGIMAHSWRELWGQTEYHVWHTGHVHHLSRKEFPSCVVETHRTLAPGDYWHHHRGYRSGSSLCAVTYHREFGERVRGTVELKLTRSVRQ